MTDLPRTASGLVAAAALIWSAAAQPLAARQDDSHPAPAPAPQQPVSPVVPFAPAALTPDDYARAERFLSWNADELVHGTSVSPNWLDGDRFWYRNKVRGGHEFVLVDPEARTRERAFDHDRLARELSERIGRDVDALDLPFTSFELAADARSISFSVDDDAWSCDIVAYACAPAEPPPVPAADAVVSPDGRLAAFIREHDLWVTDLGTGAETRLTTDGGPGYGYATDNEGWRRSDRPVLLWSPDSRAIATFRLDERGVGEMHLLETTEPRPRLHSWAYALPGDEAVPMLERVVVRVDSPGVVRLQSPPDHQRTSSCCGMTRDGSWADVEWSEDGRHLAFVSVSRDYRDVALRIADPATGQVRTVIEEHGHPFFESSAAGRGVPNWRVLHRTGDVLWYSSRSGWGHLYRYDLASGELRNQVTSGDWSVIDVLSIDEAEGWVYFTAAGREDGHDPYWRLPYRVRPDGSGLTLLSHEPADHEIAFSPSGRFYVDAYSRPEQPQVTVLRNADGATVRVVETADISELRELGWPAPRPFTVSARDGETELYGLMYLPSNMDESRRYPIINHIYPGPQTGSVRARTFSAARAGQPQALAELGFVVVQVDALGTPMRSRDFHAYYYGDLGDNGLEDQIAAMRQLAERHEWIDIERAGIYGHSGGGFASVAALLRHPDFFSVAVASAGNHDNRGYTYYWGEKWQGLLERDQDGDDNYEPHANHLLAGELRGRLLLSYGTMDANVHPNTTLLLIDALIRHNKDFDLIVFPNRGHGYSNEPYKIRRTWDYFVEHLLGAEPPREYPIRPPANPDQV